MKTIKSPKLVLIEYKLILGIGQNHRNNWKNIWLKEKKRLWARKHSAERDTSRKMEIKIGLHSHYGMANLSVLLAGVKTFIGYQVLSRHRTQRYPLKPKNSHFDVETQKKRNLVAWRFTPKSAKYLATRSSTNVVSLLDQLRKNILEYT